MEYVERDLFKDPLAEAEIRAYLGDRPALEWLATRSPRFKELGLDSQGLTSEAAIAWMAREPYLVRRPSFAVAGRLVAIGLDERALLACLRSR